MTRGTLRATTLGSDAKAEVPRNYIIDDNSKVTGDSGGDSGGDSDSDSDLSAQGKQLRKEGGESNATIINEDEEDKEHVEPRAPINLYQPIFSSFYCWRAVE